MIYIEFILYIHKIYEYNIWISCNLIVITPFVCVEVTWLLRVHSFEKQPTTSTTILQVDPYRLHPQLGLGLEECHCGQWILKSAKWGYVWWTLRIWINFWNVMSVSYFEGNCSPVFFFQERIYPSKWTTFRLSDCFNWHLNWSINRTSC